MDVIGGRNLYARLHERLLRGYVLDAVSERGNPGIEAQPELAQLFLAAVEAAPRVSSPTVGRGEYAVVTGGVVGSELRDGELLPHLCAFPGETGWESGRDHALDTATPLASPSQRRHHGRTE
jgi:hypothetical protein